MAVEYDISSDVAVIKEVGSVSQCARVTQMYSGQITYDDEAGSKFATATINGKSQRVMLCIAVNGTVTYDDVPSLYSTVDGHRCLNIVTPTETGTPDDVPSLYETVVIDGQNVRAVRCIMINKTPVYDGVSSTCTFTGDDGKTHTAQLVNKVTGGSVQVIIKGTSPLVLPDAIANSLSYVKAFGGTEQNGTPTPDAPVDIVSNNGVLKINNLFDINSVDNGHYWAADGTYTEAPLARLSNSVPVKQGDVIAVTTKVSGSSLNIRYNFFDTQMNWLSQTVYAQSSGNTHTEYLTAQQDGYFNFSGNYIGQGRIVFWDEVVIINQSNPIYTDGTVETINAHGTNLLDLANCTDGYYYSTTGEYEPAASARLSNFIPVKAGVTYTVFVYGLKGSANVRVNLFDTNKTWLSQQAVASTLNQYTAITVTATQDGYLAFSANFVTTGSCIDWSLSQVVRGSYTVATMPEYQPYYDGGTATAEMLLKVGNYQDVQSIIDGVVTRKVGVKVLDGTETFISGQNGWITEAVQDQYWENTNPYVPICSHFVGTSDTPTSGSNTVRVYRTSSRTGRIYFGLDKTIYTSATVFQQWLAGQYAAGTPVIVLYPLETPTTESVAGQTLQVTGGDNVLEITQASLTGLELEAQYNAAVSLTIQEVQDANLDNNVTVTIQ